MTSKRFQTTRLQDVLLQYLREEGLETPLLEHRATQAWSELMGPTVAKYTGNVYMERGTLCVKIKSAPLRQNLQIIHKDIIKKINNHLGAPVVCSIKFF